MGRTTVWRSRIRWGGGRDREVSDKPFSGFFSFLFLSLPFPFPLRRGPWLSLHSISTHRFRADSSGRDPCPRAAAAAPRTQEDAVCRSSGYACMRCPAGCIYTCFGSAPPPAAGGAGQRSRARAVHGGNRRICPAAAGCPPLLRARAGRAPRVPQDSSAAASRRRAASTLPPHVGPQAAGPQPCRAAGCECATGPPAGQSER